MELKVEARNVELKKGWQMKIEEEKEKLLKHHASFVLHLRVSIEATAHHKEGGYEVKIVASVPNDTVVVTKKGERVRPLAHLPARPYCSSVLSCTLDLPRHHPPES